MHSQIVSAVTFGSNTSPSRLLTQQTLNTGDVVAGFVALDGGFALNSYITTATFNCFFPVSGNVALNGGTFGLQKNLYLENPALFMSAGLISGGNFNFEASPLTTLPYPLSLLSGCGLTFITSVQPSAQTITSCDWSWDSQFLVASTNAVALSTVLFVYGYDGTQLTARGSGSGGSILLSSINSVRWHPSQYVIAVAQSNLLGITAQIATFSYNPATNTITNLSSAASLLQDGMAVDWNATGTLLASGTGGTIATNALVNVHNVNSAGAITTLAASFAIAQPVLTVRGVQPNALNWDKTNNFIAIGLTNTSLNQQLTVLRFTPPSTLVSDSTANIGSTVTAVAWNPTSTDLLVIGINATSGNIVQLWQHGVGTLTQIASGSIPGIGAAVRELAWNKTGTCLVVGADSNGTSDKFQCYSFNSVARTFTLITNFSALTTDNRQSASWAPNGLWVGDGGVLNTLSTYDLTSYVLTNTCMTLQNVNWLIDQDLFIQGVCVKLSGTTIVNGQGNIVTIGPNASIIIDKGASVLFENIALAGIHTGQLFCLDNIATMSFQNAQLILDGNYTFTMGRMDVFNSLVISGQGKSFIYSTTAAPTLIWNNATLKLDDGVTFSYQPANNVLTSLQFTDTTSVLLLSNAVFATAAAGVTFLKGKMRVDGATALSATGTSALITFGDGTNVSNDFFIRMLPAASLFISNSTTQFNNL
jgi:hypothetical protein